MVTVKIKREVKVLLDDFKMIDESMDSAVNRLLDLVEEDMGSDMIFGGGSTNINLSRDTMRRVKDCGVHDRESYGRILHRALILASLLDDG